MGAMHEGRNDDAVLAHVRDVDAALPVHCQGTGAKYCVSLISSSQNVCRSDSADHEDMLETEYDLFL